MIWNVYCEDWNNKEIVKFNIFDHAGFYDDVCKAAKKCETKEEFANEVKQSLMYYFWSRAEYEIVLTSLTCNIDKKELDRLNTEYEEYNTKYGHYPYQISVYPTVGKKVDVFSQVELNFDAFIDYCWNNCNKKKKKREKLK